MIALVLLSAVWVRAAETQVDPDLINTETYYIGIDDPASETGCYKIVMGTSVVVDATWTTGTCDASRFAGSPVSLGTYSATAANAQVWLWLVTFYLSLSHRPINIQSCASCNICPLTHSE
jgi:hypothetical protein